ncbi:NRPS protein [Claviceps digitariae]|nr:NRPS protein [Claviceps digitariae]
MSLSDVEESTLADIANSCNISPAAIEDIYECTPGQMDMLERKKPDLHQIVISMNSLVNLERWREAFRLVISRNAILRTRFLKLESGKPLQVVLKMEEVGHDIMLPDSFDDVDGFLQLRTDTLTQQWFGLPLLQATFIGSKFVATIHHGIMDWWSWATLFNVDVVAAYLGHQVPDRPAFKEFVRYCNTIDQSVAENFWQQRFRGETSCFPQAFNSEPTLTRITRGSVRETVFQPEAIGDVARSQISFYIEAAWAITSSIYTASDSVAYGYLISGRSSSSHGLHSTLGPVFSEVPVQVHLQPNMTVGQLLKDRIVSLRQLQAHPATHWGLRKINAAIWAISDAARYGSILNIMPEHPASPSATSPSDTRAEDLLEPRVQCDIIMPFEPCFPLHLVFRLRHGGFDLEPRFDPESISESRLKLVLDQFDHVLRLLLQARSHEKLSSLDFLNHGDRARISAWNNKSMSESTVYSTVHAAFLDQVLVRPDATAVEDIGQVNGVTYRALDQMSDRLAELLHSRGISRNVPVCLVSERSTWAIVAILGIMKAGGIFVPIDINASREDRAAICSKVQARVLLASSTQYATCVGLEIDVLVVNATSINEAPTRDSSHRDELECYSTDTALLHFTSGSSTCSGGQGEEARGIMFAHRTLISSLKSQAKVMGWQPGCRILHNAAYASGWSVCEVLGALLSGGCVCIPSVKNPSIYNIPPEPQADWAILGPSALDYTSSSAARNSSQHSVLCVDSLCRVQELSAWSTSTNRLIRGWGTSETCFISTMADIKTSCSELEDEYIGFPIGSCSTWIVNPHNVHDLAPVGSMGELLFSGAGVAQGYWADDTKTASCFISPPRWAAEFGKGTGKFYRTGYLARYNMDGSIALVGKQSNRVKMRGHTVQLEQLERTLRRHCVQLRDVACLTQIRSGRTQVVALVCLTDPRLPSGQALQKVHDEYQGIVDQNIAAAREVAESKLPASVIPSIWHAVERLPWVDHQDLDRYRIRQWLEC